MVQTNDYYQKNAQEFFQQTLAVDMELLRSRFLAHVPKSGIILDAGCGSGRDAKAFIDSGYQVKAFDAAPTLARLAENYIGQKVDVLSFQNLAVDEEFDGVWACASILHVPLDDLSDVFLRIFRSLKPNGTLYASFKYGSGESDRNGRKFTDMNEAGLDLILEQVNCFDKIEIWVSVDRRPGHENQLWLNTLLRAREKE